MFCHEFENSLSDYLDERLDKETRSKVAAHALQCPVCHELLNAVKSSMKMCHEAAVFEIRQPSPQLEARILQMTMPETAMTCDEFEELLTDYLDGFLPAYLFHRWERHACLCSHCTNLPGEVVRSIGVCYTYKANELPLPEGLHKRILEMTLGTANTAKVRMSVFEQIKQMLESILKPIFSPVFTPQLASVAMMLVVAFFVLTNSISVDGSISSIYQQGAQLAAQTYEESANVVENGFSGSLDLKNDPENREDVAQ